MGLLQFIGLSKSKPWEQIVNLHCSPLLFHHCDCVRNMVHDYIQTRDQLVQQYIPYFQRSTLHRLCHGIQLQLESKPYSKNDLLVWKGNMGNATYIKLNLFQNRIKNNNDTIMLKANQEINVLKQLSSIQNSSICQLLCYQTSIHPIFYILESPKDSETLGKYLIKRHQMYEKKSTATMLTEIIIPCVSAVEFCHSRDIVVRDLTADSFLIATKAKQDIQIQLEIPNLARDLTILSNNVYKGKEMLQRNLSNNFSYYVKMLLN